MSQITPIIGSGKSGLEYRNLDNDAKRALLNHHKGSSMPTYAEAGCLWLDDSDTPWLLKFYDGSDWVVLARINATDNHIDAIDFVSKPNNPITAEDNIVFADMSAGGILAKNTVGNILQLATIKANQYTKAQNFTATTLTDASSIAWNLEDNQVASVTLGGNRTLANPANMQAGATYILIVKQGATPRTLAFGSAYKFSGGEVPVLTSAANAIDILTFVSDGTNMYGVIQEDFI